MEIFGWIMGVILVLVGLAFLGISIASTFITYVKVCLYKSKKTTDEAKVRLDIQSEDKVIREKELREKQKEIEDIKYRKKVEKVENKLQALKKKEEAEKENNSEAE